MYKVKSESSTKSGRSMDGSYSFVQDDKPCKCSYSSLEALPDSKWWLLDSEARLFGSIDSNRSAKVASERNRLIEEYYTFQSQNDATFCSDSPSEQFYSDAKSDQDNWVKELLSATHEELKKTPVGKEMERLLHSNANPRHLDPSNCRTFEEPKKLSSDLGSDLIGLDTVEPWWHTADSRDLAFLASHRQSEFVGNCDLPEAQAMHCVKGPGDYFNCAEQVIEQVANKETNLSHVADRTRGTRTSIKDGKGSGVVNYNQRNLTSIRVNSLGMRGLTESVAQGPDGTLSHDNSTTMEMDLSDPNGVLSDMSRSELLEALCHSQTRAREAEKFAQEACDEKEHVVNLFFRQASYLFAYRQWLRILQLETLCLQLKSKNQANAFAAPFRKNRRRVAKKGQGKPRPHLGKYVVAFALGLSLAGAGLFVGLTIGWLFPAF